MNRLTKKYCNNYDEFISSFRSSLITGSELRNGIYKKLKQLEDIEEKLGIDFSILFKVINGSVFVKCWDGSIDEVEATIGYVGDDCVLQFNDMMNNDHKCYYPYTTKDYTKTWALTREELEENE